MGMDGLIGWMDGLDVHSDVHCMRGKCLNVPALQGTLVPVLGGVHGCAWHLQKGRTSCVLVLLQQ
jgi:hypothetical protein